MEEQEVESETETDVQNTDSNEWAKGGNTKFVKFFIMPFRMINKISGNRFKKIDRRGIAILSILFFIWYLIYFYKTEMETKAYYDGVEQVLDAREYYFFTYEDIYNLYGVPSAEEVASGSCTYDMGEYSLKFTFERGYVGTITYTPYIGTPYVNIFYDPYYLFELVDETSRTKYIKWGIIANVDIDVEYESQLIKEVVIEYREREIYEYIFQFDYEDIPVIFNLKRYVGQNKSKIVALLGEATNKENENLWIYNMELGDVVIEFENEYATTVSFIANEPIKYENTTQEALVMFGCVNTGDKLYLEDYNYYGEYEVYTIDDYENSIATILGIDVENKTFNKVSIS